MPQPQSSQTLVQEQELRRESLRVKYEKAASELAAIETQAHQVESQIKAISSR